MRRRERERRDRWGRIWPIGTDMQEKTRKLDTYIHKYTHTHARAPTHT